MEPSDAASGGSPWRASRSVTARDLVGTVAPDGTISAAESYVDLHASMEAKLDPDRRALAGTVDSNGCIYRMRLAA